MILRAFFFGNSEEFGQVSVDSERAFLDRLLGHEHQNPDGGILWNEDVVIRDLSGSQNSWDMATVRHNVISKYTHDQINGTEFDDESNSQKGC